MKNKKEVWLKISKKCALIWLLTYPFALLLVALTNGDFTTLREVINPSLEDYLILKIILNIGLNLHIATTMPAAYFFITHNPKPKDSAIIAEQEDIRGPKQ